MTSDNGDAFESISEGCFLVFPSPQHTANKRRKTSENEYESEATHCDLRGFQTLFDNQEPIEALKLRLKFYESKWQFIRSLADSALKELNQATLDELLKFVAEAHCHTLKQNMCALPFHELPTALVFPGINVPDHDLLFDQVSSTLEGAGNFVARLHSKNCGSIKAMIKSITEQFIETEAEINDEEEENTIFVPSTTTSTKKKSPCRVPSYDMQVLEGWYNHLVDNHNNRRRQEGYMETDNDNAKLGNLVVIVQDFESFEPATLEDFIAICSEYLSRIPIVLIMGIATSIETMQQALSRSTLTLLRTEKFQMQRAEKVFDALTEAIIFREDEEGIGIGPSLYRHLMDNFFLHNFSIGSFLSSLQYAYMHFFYANPLSIFAYLDIKKVECVLTSDHIEMVQMQPSFQNYIDSMLAGEPSKVHHILTTREGTLSALDDAFTRIRTYLAEFVVIFEVLWQLELCFWAMHDIRKPRRMLYLQALEEDLGSSDHIKTLCMLMSKMKLEELGQFLERTVSTLEEAEMRWCGEKTVLKSAQITVFAKEKLGELRRIEVQKMEAEEEEEEEESEEYSGDKKDNFKESRRQTATSRRVRSDKETEEDEFILVRRQVCEFFKNEFHCCLARHTTLPLYELYWYSSVRLHQKAFTPQHRASVQTALGHPRHYINCLCCNENPSNSWNSGAILSSSLQDTCILYRLYLECGRVINLYDWYIAFCMVLEKDGVEEKEAVARFTRGIAELQFLGFIKPTNRKTDHVQRLTWGSI
ncbi:uncharacterized protein VTP21DRAFT_10460 [Calcarisporiella thermophila]|uniref:uncharacterized protein n=1 Tax=Calcarisporiella thermophila TaxID=911321 RepID=UPI0037439DCA